MTIHICREQDLQQTLPFPCSAELENKSPIFSQEVVGLGGLPPRASWSPTMADGCHDLARDRLLRLALPCHPIRRPQAEDQGSRHQDREAVRGPRQGQGGRGCLQGL